MSEKNKFIFKQSIIIFCLTILFTIIVFLIKNYYFSAGVSNQYIEENYIEPRVKSDVSSEEIDILDVNTEDNTAVKLEKSNSGEIIINDVSLSGSQVSDLIEEHYRSAAPFVFKYIPDYFEKKSKGFTKTFGTILQSKAMKHMIHDLNIELHEELHDVRGKMKKKSVKLFGYHDHKHGEYTSVAIHELAHYIDIYFLEKKVFQDISDEFYKISWKETKDIRPRQTQENFVSGYAMTNKYEDFAESFTYYILHNDDFLRKTLSSDELSAKYYFFDTILFKKKFNDTDFSVNNTVRDYYRDITKIDIDVEKLLQYLKNGI